MDKKWSKFIGQNLKLLLSSKLNIKDEIHKKRREYFVILLKNEIKLPKDSEIAKKTAGYLKTTIKKSDNEIIKIFEDSKYLKESLPKELLLNFLSSLEDTNSILSPEDIKKGRISTYLSQVDKDKEREIQLAKENSEKELAKKIESLEKLTKITIDKYNTKVAQIDEILSNKLVNEEDEIDESAIIDTSNQFSDDSSWWGRLGLTSNPFPSNLGLKGFNQESWEEIVIKTEIFDYFNKNIRNNPEDFLQQSILVTGEFGSGKTTLFWYLEKPLLISKIYPIQLILDPNDSNQIMTDFLKDIKYNLNKIYKESFNVDINAHFPGIDKNTLLEIMEQIRDAQSFRGFCIFIDGLHKNSEKQEEVFTFLKRLQNILEFFSGKGLNIATIVAGHSRWRKDIQAKESFSGTFSDMKEMPTVSIEDALELFNKRFFTFAKDKSAIPKIYKKQLEQVYKAVQSRKTEPVTFRDMIDEILPHLKNSDLDYIQIGLKFDCDKLQKIKSALFGQTGGAQIKKLFESLQEKRKIDILLKHFIYIYNKKGLNEQDSQVKLNQESFKALLKFNLISRRIINKENYFVISQDLINLDEDIKGRFGFSLNEYLFDIIEPTSLKIENQDNADIDIIDKFLLEETHWSERLRPRLINAIDNHKVILDYLKSPILVKTVEDRNNLIVSVKRATILLIESLILVDSGEDTKFVDNISNANKKIKQMWYGNDLTDNYDQLIDKIILIESTEDIEISAIVEITTLSKFVFSLLLKRLINSIKSEHIFELSSKYLTKNDKKKFGKIREYLMKDQPFFAARDLGDYYEKKLREFLYNILEIKYGDKWKSRLGAEVNKEVLVNQSKSENKRYLEQIKHTNVLYYCDRSSYRVILIDVMGNWGEIFAHLFKPLTKDYIDSQLNQIVSLTVRDKHNEKSEFFAKNSTKLIESSRTMLEVIKKVNLAYSIILSKENIFVQETPFGYNVNFSFLKNGDNENINPAKVSNEQIEIVRKRLTKEFIGLNKSIDLSDREFLETFFGIMEYRTIIAGLAVLILNEDFKITFSISSFNS